MLQTIRERAQGWIAWVIVVLISIPFALWGIQSYLGVGAEPVVATVNGVEISQRDFDNRYRELRVRLREQLGAAYRPEMFNDKTMRGEVLEQIIRDNLLMQESNDLGLRASDRELRGVIASNPAFQKDGKFDNATYERTLELQGMTPLQFEASLRQRIVGTQLSRAIIATEILPSNELKESILLGRQQRRLSLISVSKTAFHPQGQFSDAEISGYYESHRAQFKIPERIKVQYLVLDAKALGSGKAPSEAQLRERYEAEKANFTQPERRRVRHILVTLNPNASKAEQDAAKAKIIKIRERIAAGEDFAKLAKELSQDPGSAGKGGDLGFIDQGMMDPAFDKAAFSLGIDQLSEPVRSQFGYHLIEVTRIEPKKIKPFDEVKEQLAAELTKQGDEKAYYDLAERLANLSYESPDSLEPAAEAIGLKLQTSGWINRSGGKGILANPKVVAAAFSDEVLKEGNNSDLIEPEPNRLQAIVLRVVEHEEATTKPLNEVMDQIVASLRNKRASEAAVAKAAEIVKALEAGGDTKTVAAEYELKDIGLISRDAAQVSAEIRDFAFRLPRPGKGGTSYGSLTLANGDAATVILSEVVDGSEKGMDKATLDQTRKTLAHDIGQAYYDDLLSDLESRATIKRRAVAGEGQEE